MEPIYENIQPNIGSSFYYNMSSPGCCDPFWHIHPEYELVYIQSGSAERHIGSNVSCYENGDLLLIGSNIPHSNLGNHDRLDNKEIVIQMSDSFIETKLVQFDEFEKIKELFKLSCHGISFTKKIKNCVSPLLIKMNSCDEVKRLLLLIEVLNILANTSDYELLHVKDVSITIQANDYSRINKISEFVAQNYQNNIQLKDIADLTGLTETSFSRFFKKVTGKTFITFLNEYRIQKACILLSNQNNRIVDVMLQTGFNEPAHFTRIFKQYTRYAPRDYRKKLRGW